MIPRSRRARAAISAIRHQSRQFRQAVAAKDALRIESVSGGAWDALTNLFETLRNEHDHGYLDRSHLMQSVGLLVEPATRQEQVGMQAARRVDRSHSSCAPLTLIEALNKLGHYDTAQSTYRIDGRGAHYLILGGRRGSRKWVAEILVSRLCDEASTAAKAIRQFPRP